MAESEHFELVVIGSGPGGEKGAAQAAYFGRKVALVERAPEVGGACVHTGTLPSKTLRETALYLTGFRRRELYGMSVRFDRKKSLRQLVGRLREVTLLQTQQIGRNLKRHGIELVSGSARFEDPHTVAVLDPEGRVTRRLSADFFLIATGSSPIPPRGIAMTDPDIVDSDRILDLDRVPAAMTVVGGGVIGTEYACLFAALGTRITLVEGRDRLLGGVDEELSCSLQLSLERMGAEILFGDAVESVERLPGRKTKGLALKLKSGRQLRADKVLFSAGRSGNTKGLNLEGVGVAVTERGHIKVNEHFQTSLPHLYAAGDVIGFPALAATSMEQGRVAVCHAFGIAYKTQVSPFQPYGIFSIPEISTIGPSEQELKEKGIAYEVGHARFENNARGQITGDTDGFIKILFDPETRKLLSAHILGEDATELVHIPLFVLSSGGTIDAFIDAVFNFPTLAESFKYAAYDGLQRLAQRDPATAPPAVAASDRPAPAMRPWFVGLSLPGAPAARQPIVVCVMDRWRRCRFVTWSYEPDAAGLLSEEVERDGFVLALGVADSKAPLLADALRRRGFSLAGLPSEALAKEGGSVEQADVVLVNPDALWKTWGVKSARRQAGIFPARRKQYETLRAKGLELPVAEPASHRDQLDAAAAAYAAYLWATGQATAEIAPG
ncbi:MAG TPA: Si-specific NAD(P)(+) transhydrogenase [Thermoanaerobaculia bacterium]|nr:Si-specific NAD(P)(+) transhydrogenase [Thermoanaerobaculia bacterium]